jgi:hypothetical protein
VGDHVGIPAAVRFVFVICNPTCMLESVTHILLPRRLEVTTSQQKDKVVPVSTTNIRVTYFSIWEERFFTALIHLIGLSKTMAVTLFDNPATAPESLSLRIFIPQVVGRDDDQHVWVCQHLP